MIMPPRAAMQGKAALEGEARTPSVISLFNSRPTEKKKRAMSPSFTHPCIVSTWPPTVGPKGRAQKAIQAGAVLPKLARARDVKAAMRSSRLPRPDSSTLFALPIFICSSDTGRGWRWPDESSCNVAARRPRTESFPRQPKLLSEGPLPILNGAVPCAAWLLDPAQGCADGADGNDWAGEPVENATADREAAARPRAAAATQQATAGAVPT
mmetsp:Transcript_26682/g.58660  ORF Transcript_26682/g.58660 Transcript_26682/m.58660 type:complete len:211 (-) Transcript_26682:104-736(-)